MTQSPLSRAVHHATTYLAGLDSQPVAPTVTRDELVRRFDGPMPALGTEPDRIIDELAAAADGALVSNASARFFAWVIGGAHRSAIAAEWLATAWDQNAVIYATSPLASVIEEVTGKWLLELLRLPREASFAFTTGCQTAHFTALLAAREHLLRQRGWDAGSNGLAGSPPIRVLVSPLRHVSLDRALRYMGVGTRQLVELPVDAAGALKPLALERALDEIDAPTIVGLNAADLNSAAFDSFAELVPIAHRHDAWVHVDGAFGLFARTSDRYLDLVAGMELADSWATDCHKWLNVPQDCGFAVVRNREAHRRAFTIHDSYFVSEESARDEIDWTPDWSRRARAFATYAVLRELGSKGVANLIERSCDHCAALVVGIGGIEGAEVVMQARLNQGLVRFLDVGPGATDADHDAQTDRVIAGINAGGEAMFGGVTWHGRRVMRVCVVNWQTGADDVTRTIEAVRSAIVRATATSSINPT
ncbi:MAG: pyridoxal phosphate-dependent decarboxylase family protein [Gemmatimonadota bacterium]